MGPAQWDQLSWLEHAAGDPWVHMGHLLRELGSWMPIVGPIQLRLFCDSLISSLNQV